MAVGQFLTRRNRRFGSHQAKLETPPTLNDVNQEEIR
jgi:hypothetical protein